MLLTENDFPQAKIQCAVFKGTTRNIFIDKREYNGPIQDQIEEAYQFVLRNIRLGATIRGLYRVDDYELPMEGIRELICNAVTHRSYLDEGCVQVAVFDNRLEVTSPGMLFGGLSIEDLKEGQSRPRNRGIASAFVAMKMLEQWGTGIPRIIEMCKEYELQEPEFIEIGMDFRVNMYREQTADGKENQLNEDKKVAIEDKKVAIDIIDEKCTNEGLSNIMRKSIMEFYQFTGSDQVFGRKDIANYLNFSYANAGKVIMAMKKADIIMEIIGKGRESTFSDNNSLFSVKKLEL